MRTQAAATERELIELGKQVGLASDQIALLTTIKSEFASTRAEVATLAATQAHNTNELVEINKLELSSLVAKSQAQQHLLEGMTNQVQKLTERVEASEDRSSTVLATAGQLLHGGSDGSPSEFHRLVRRVNFLESELATARQREAEHNANGVGLIKAVEAMRLRVEGLEASVSDSVEASMRREAAASVAAASAVPT